METLMLPFSPRFIVLTICGVVAALLAVLGVFDRKIFDLILVPLLIFGALTLLGIRDLVQKNRSPRISGFCSRRSARRCVNTSLRARRTACRSRATPAR